MDSSHEAINDSLQVRQLPPLHGYPLEWREGFRWEPSVVTIIDGDKKPTYRVQASCNNCSWKGEIQREKGYEPRHAYPCPDCGCKTVHSLHKLA